MYTKLSKNPESREHDSERDRLILEHLPQVKLIASRIHDKVPGSVVLDDLISAGVLGLIDAVDHFDRTLNVKLKTYAEHKIRGAILDSLRSLDWAPRNKRRKSKLIESAISKAEKKLQRTPTEEEVAEELEVSLAEYRRWLVEIRGINLAPMEQAGPGEGEGTDVLRFISDDEEQWPSNLFERSELSRLVATAIKRLPEVERTIITLYSRISNLELRLQHGTRSLLLNATTLPRKAGHDGIRRGPVACSCRPVSPSRCCSANWSHTPPTLLPQRPDFLPEREGPNHPAQVAPRSDAACRRTACGSDGLRPAAASNTARA